MLIAVYMLDYNLDLSRTDVKVASTLNMYTSKNGCTLMEQ